IMAGLKLFSEKGFEGTSTQEIATESGMSQATIFKYFKTKDDLLKFIITPIMENIVPLYVVEFKNELENKKANLEDLIKFVVHNRYQFLVDNKEVALIVLSELLTKEDVKDQFIKMMTSRGPSIVDTFQKLMDQTGEVRPGLTPIEIMRLVVSQILIYFIQNYKIFPGRKETDVEKDLQVIETMIINAIRKPTN
ncbi:TetR/AcrR family transcriptional regulator, partial [Companilactobacillus sp.]|uniref:TetR/AcrR family transcriptional regulator n=1 Tax=Companilactobacillus sp. TaxID=2767905 RepID=UPI00261DF931